MKLEIVHVDTCLPDYWRGHHIAHFSIPVWHGMSMTDIKRSLVEEINQGCVAGSDKIVDLFNGYGSDQEIEKVYKRARSAIKRLKPAKKGQRKFFTDLEKDSDSDCDVSVYAYFLIVEAN